ncbi:MAG: hypothetical protein V4513_02485 [Pseudomonadota bacterium]
MQEKYLGDSHDYLKYALLRHLARTLRLRIGVNWYFTEPESVDSPGNNDGLKRHHLTGRGWRGLDEALFPLIAQFVNPSARQLTVLQGSNVLPSDTLYYGTPVPLDDRCAWLEESSIALDQSQLIFLDPDNGFEVKSMSRRTAPKYALLSDPEVYLRARKTVIGIQFARQCDPVERAYAIQEKLQHRYGRYASLPIIRGRVAPNILFFTLADPDQQVPLQRALVGFAAHAARVAAAEACPSRVEILLPPLSP